MKRVLVMLLAALMVLTCFAGCGASGKSDLKYIQDKGTMIVGITDYAPMDYKDENGEWTGFDAELAQLVCEKLGVKCEFFVLADWGKKFYELETKNIDAIWNGMTITEEVTLNTNCSAPYVVNAQVLVMKADVVGDYDLRGGERLRRSGRGCGGGNPREPDHRRSGSGGSLDGSGCRYLGCLCDRYYHGQRHDR